MEFTGFSISLSWALRKLTRLLSILLKFPERKPHILFFGSLRSLRSLRSEIIRGISAKESLRSLNESRMDSLIFCFFPDQLIRLAQLVRMA